MPPFCRNPLFKKFPPNFLLFCREPFFWPLKGPKFFWRIYPFQKCEPPLLRSGDPHFPVPLVPHPRYLSGFLLPGFRPFSETLLEGSFHLAWLAMGPAWYHPRNPGNGFSKGFEDPFSKDPWSCPKFSLGPVALIR